MIKIVILSLGLLLSNIQLLSQNNFSIDLYYNSVLGIRFQPDMSKIAYEDFIQDVDTANWLDFSWLSNNIHFKYPPYLRSKKYTSSEDKKLCDSLVVFEYTEEDSIFHTIFSVYLTRGNFSDAAFNAGFDTSTSIYDSYPNPPPQNERIPLWITYGRQGMVLEADSIYGNNWSGLIGRNSIGIDVGGMMGLGYSTQIFLILKQNDTCNIVFDCYYDSETKSDFSEFEFIKIVEDFYKNYIYKN
jgi:hypothetical protein